MPLTQLDHYFVRSNDMERSKDFYCGVLGFDVMPRPNLPVPGYWLGVDGKVQIHMGPDDIADPESFYFGTTEKSARDNAGVVDHIAFQGTDPEAIAKQLKAAGVASQTRYFAEIQLFQIFVSDPDGLMIELNFPSIASEPELD